MKTFTIRLLISLVLAIGAAVPAAGQVTFQPGPVRPLFGDAATSTTVYSNSIVLSVPWDPTVGAGRNVTAPTGYPTAALFFSKWNPSADRSVRAIGLANIQRLETGNFTASTRGFFNEVDVVTTGTTVSVQGITNDVVTHGGPATHPDVTGLLNRVFAQGSGAITDATGIQVDIESDGPAIGNAVGVYSVVNNYGSGIGQGIAFYAGPSNLSAATKASFYAEPGSGQAEFDDGTLTPILSHNASSVLSVAANVIAPTNAVHHVGAGLIKTITKPATCTATCSVMLIPDAAFTTDATGNISLASTAVVNRVLIMVWDGTKWNPSY